MTNAEFEKNCKEMWEHCWRTLSKKKGEYASDEDRLFNCKQPTSLFGINPAEVCLYYDSKHIASMVKIAQDANKGQLPSIELLQEKVGDYLNYGLLFYSVMLEMIENENSKRDSE